MKIDEEGFFSSGEDHEASPSDQQKLVFPQYNMLAKKMGNVKKIKPLCIYQNA